MAVDGPGVVAGDVEDRDDGDAGVADPFLELGEGGGAEGVGGADQVVVVAGEEVGEGGVEVELDLGVGPGERLVPDGRTVVGTLPEEPMTAVAGSVFSQLSEGDVSTGRPYRG